MGFEALIVVSMNVQVSLDMTTCRLVSTDLLDVGAVSVFHLPGVISQRT